MISKKLLKEFNQLDHYDQMDYLFAEVKNGNLNKEKFKHLLRAYVDTKNYSDALTLMSDNAGSSW